MTDSFKIPPEFTAMGEAVRPIAMKIKARIDAPVNRTITEYEISAFIPNHLDKIRNGVRAPERIVSALNSACAEEADIKAIYRHAGRLEHWLDGLLDGYTEVRSLDARDEDAQAQKLLAGIYLHFFTEVQDWLNEIIGVCTDPMTVIEKRGLPTSGKVTFELSLKPTPSPQEQELVDWIKQRTNELEQQQVDNSQEERPPKEEIGFWGHVAVFVLGIGILEMLFGGDDCDC